MAPAVRRRLIVTEPRRGGDETVSLARKGLTVGQDVLLRREFEDGTDACTKCTQGDDASVRVTYSHDSLVKTLFENPPFHGACFLRNKL